MTARFAAVFAAVVSLWAGAAYAGPSSQDASSTQQRRAQLIAARMSTGESYDQAARAVPQAPSDEREQAIQLALSKGTTYRQAKLDKPERSEVVNARWNKHLLTMQQGASHEAGWEATAR